MATYTRKLNLKKPNGNELFNRVQDLNDNWDKIDAIDSSDITFTPIGDLSSTDVQTALAELDSEKATKLFATNLVTNGDFSNGTTGWTNLGLASFTVASNEATILSNSQYDTLKFAFPIFSINDLIYVRASLKSTSNLAKFYLRQGESPYDTAFIYTYTGSGSYIVASGIGKIANITSSYGVEVRDERTSGFDNIYVKGVHALNLTALFGAGNEPTKEQMDWIFTERDRLGLGHINGTQELLPMVSLLNLINKKANIAQEAWITPTLLNGATGTIKYRKNQFGRLEFIGDITCLNGASSNFNLQAGYIPTAHTYINVITDDNVVGKIIIFNSGAFFYGASAINGKKMNMSNISVPLN